MLLVVLHDFSIDQKNFEEYLTVRNALKALDTIKDQWIRISELLGVPSSVVNSILVSQLSDEESLKKSVEWWFRNTANPEWTTIQKIRNLN